MLPKRNYVILGKKINFRFVFFHEILRIDDEHTQVVIKFLISFVSEENAHYFSF